MQDESFGPVVSRWWELTVRDATEHGYGTASLNAGDSFDHDVGAEPLEGNIGLNGQRDPRITTNIS
jgi:hypothetical protein